METQLRDACVAFFIIFDYGGAYNNYNGTTGCTFR